MKKYGKRLAVLGFALGLSASMSFAAYAGAWKKDAVGWWYQNDDGSYPTNSWHWLDGNQDGIAECYYFGADGYLLTNTVTPDNYTVNADGAWTVDGAVQVQLSQAASQQEMSITEWENLFRQSWIKAYTEVSDAAYLENPNRLGPVNYSFHMPWNSAVSEELLHSLCVDCAQGCMNRAFYYAYHFNGNEENGLIIKAISSPAPILQSMMDEYFQD